MEPRRGEGRELLRRHSQVGGKHGRQQHDVTIDMADWEFAEHIARRCAARERDLIGDAPGFQAFPKTFGRPNGVAFESDVYRGVDLSKGRVEFVDDLPHLWKLALHLTAEELHIRRHFDAPVWHQDGEHRIEFARSAGKAWALSQLLQQPFHHRR
jgi:hypothetical protein